MSQGRRITLTEEGEWWIARDEDAGITTHGRTRTDAIDNLDEAVACEQAAIEDGDEPLGEAEHKALFDELGLGPEDMSGSPLTPPWEEEQGDS